MTRDWFYRRNKNLYTFSLELWRIWMHFFSSGGVYFIFKGCRGWNSQEKNKPDHDAYMLSFVEKESKEIGGEKSPIRKFLFFEPENRTSMNLTSSEIPLWNRRFFLDHGRRQTTYIWFTSSFWWTRCLFSQCLVTTNISNSFNRNYFLVGTMSNGRMNRVNTRIQ